MVSKFWVENQGQTNLVKTFKTRPWFELVLLTVASLWEITLFEIPLSIESLTRVKSLILNLSYDMIYVKEVSFYSGVFGPRRAYTVGQLVQGIRNIALARRSCRLEVCRLTMSILFARRSIIMGMDMKKLTCALFTRK